MLDAMRLGRRLITGLGTAILLPLPAVGAADVSLVWTSTTGTGIPGSSAIDAQAGDLLTAELHVTPGPEGLSAIGLSLQFDADGGDELDLVSASELCTPGSCAGLQPLTTLALATVDSEPGSPGIVESYEAASLSNGPVAGTLTLGSVVVKVTSNVATDGDDVAFVLRPGVDGLLDNANATTDATFGSAAVNVPEPTLLMMIGVGAPMLGWLAGRRERARER